MSNTRKDFAIVGKNRFQLWFVIDAVRLRREIKLFLINDYCHESRCHQWKPAQGREH